MSYFQEIFESVISEGVGRKRANSIEHGNKEVELDMNKIEKETTKWKTKGIERRYFKDGPLKGSFFTKDDNPAGEKKFTFKNGNIVTKRGSSIDRKDIEKHVTKYHKSGKDDGGKIIGWASAYPDNNKDAEPYHYPIHAAKKNKKGKKLKEYSSTEAKQIADTIASQLGGYGKLKSMIGADNFGYDEDGSLSFKIKASSKFKYCKIKLNANDLYDVEFFSQSGKPVKSMENVYAEDLKRIFEETTRLYMSL